MKDSSLVEKYILSFRADNTHSPSSLLQRGKLKLSRRLRPRDLWAFRASWDLD